MTYQPLSNHSKFVLAHDVSTGAPFDIIDDDYGGSLTQVRSKNSFYEQNIFNGHTWEWLCRKKKVFFRFELNKWLVDDIKYI